MSFTVMTNILYLYEMDRERRKKVNIESKNVEWKNLLRIQKSVKKTSADDYVSEEFSSFACKINTQ
jgi:hypothetical protein